MLYYPQIMNFQNQMNPFYFNPCVNNNFGQMGAQLPLMATNHNNLYFYNWLRVYSFFLYLTYILYLNKIL
jgi:hypothetical protein